MDHTSIKKARYERRRWRSKPKPYQLPDRYRLIVFRSVKHIYGSIVDDAAGKTLAVSSTLDKGICNQMGEVKTKKEKSAIVGGFLAQKAIKLGIKKVSFDRNGFLYHGRVKEFAKGAREGGLEF